MKISYHVTGTERKKLVGTISTILNAPTKYLGAPTFAYEIGGYHIDKDGTLTGPENLDLEDLLHQAGFDADGDSREYDEDDTYESGLGGMGALDEFPDIDQHHPGQYAKPNASITDTMQKQLDEVLAFESLRMDGREELGLVTHWSRMCGIQIPLPSRHGRRLKSRGRLTLLTTITRVFSFLRNIQEDKITRQVVLTG